MSYLDRARERAETTERDLERGILERPPGRVSRPFDDLREEKRRADAASAADEMREHLCDSEREEEF